MTGGANLQLTQSVSTWDPKVPLERQEMGDGGGRRDGGGCRHAGHSSRWCLKSSRGSLPFTVWLNELFMFLCTLSVAPWRLNASSVAS